LPQRVEKYGVGRSLEKHGVVVANDNRDQQSGVIARVRSRLRAASAPGRARCALLADADPSPVEARQARLDVEVLEARLRRLHVLSPGFDGVELGDGVRATAERHRVGNVEVT